MRVSEPAPARRPAERHLLREVHLPNALAAREKQVRARLQYAKDFGPGTLAVDGMKAAHKKGVKLNQALPCDRCRLMAHSF